MRPAVEFALPTGGGRRGNVGGSPAVASRRREAPPSDRMPALVR